MGGLSWLSELLHWQSMQQFGMDPTEMPLQGMEEFYDALHRFLQNPFAAMVQAQLLFPSPSTTQPIVASRLSGQYMGVDSIAAQQESLLAIRALCDASPVPAFAHSRIFLMVELNQQLMSMAASTLLLAVGVVLLVTAVVLHDVFAVCCIGLGVSLVNGNTMGMMWIADFSLNPLTTTVLCVSIGLSVDYSMQ